MVMSDDTAWQYYIHGISLFHFRHWANSIEKFFWLSVFASFCSYWIDFFQFQNHASHFTESRYVFDCLSGKEKTNKIDINFKPLRTSHDWLVLVHVRFDRNGNTNPFLATNIKWNLHFFFSFSFGLSGISIHSRDQSTTKTPLFLIEIRWKQHTSHSQLSHTHTQRHNAYM